MLLDGDGHAKYKYVANKEDVREHLNNDGNIHKAYVIYISDINSNASRRLLFDTYDDVIFETNLCMLQMRQKFMLLLMIY